MEHRLGHDFSRVRVHSDTAAERSARGLSAQAYTVGQHIVFDPSRFAPATHDGRRLLAHELAHVVQQSRRDGPGTVVQRWTWPDPTGLPPILLGVLNEMDVQGEMILGTYLYGGGGKHDVDDPIWAAYMKEHNGLRLQIQRVLLPAVRGIVERDTYGRHPIAETFHVTLEPNRGFSGYALLHGSNKDAGDFQLTGWADVEEAVDPAEGDRDIELELNFVFNDIVDPNSAYLTDRVRAFFAEVATFTHAQSYHLSIHWSSSCLAEVRDGQITLSGYPSDRPRGVRPLPRATLDVPDLATQQAKEIEAGIVKELRRPLAAEDLAALAERKQSLLWSFYRLSGVMSSTYLERLSNPEPDDALPRLFRDRLSSRLRAELMEALRGKRPPGAEPL